MKKINTLEEKKQFEIDFLTNKNYIKSHLYGIKSVIWNFENIDYEILDIDYIIEKLKMIKKYNKRLIRLKFPYKPKN